MAPVQTGLDFATRKKGGFIGFDALQARREEGATNHIVSLAFADQNAVPLGHEPIYADGQIVGQTSSAAYGYRVGAPVALGHANGLTDGQSVQVDIAREMFDATVTIGPLYDPDGTRMKPR